MMRKGCLNLLSALLFLLPLCAQAGMIELPQTGQQVSYAAEDDGALRQGVAWPSPRFVDNGDQTITDTLTGLMWERSAYSGNWDRSSSGVIVGTYTWQSALYTADYYNSIHHLGYSDWRLPNVDELKSLVNLGAPDQAQWLMSQGFVNVLDQYYLTSTDRYMQVAMADGRISYSPYTYAWFVRGGQSGAVSLPKTGKFTCTSPDGYWMSCSGSRQDGSLQMGVAWPAPRFTDNSKMQPADLTVVDNLTGLVWAKDAGRGGMMTWQQAVDYIEILNNGSYLGHSDWRLPNLNELESLSHYQYTDASYLRNNGFINVGSWYWSSSTYAVDPSSAWVMQTGNKYTYPRAKSSVYYVWPVRAGAATPKTPVITWADPADIVYGTPLSAAQLNATADVAGTFLYTPGPGTVLTAGVRTLSVTFTPSDPACTAATKTVAINVAKAVPVISWAIPAGIAYGTPLSAAQLDASANVAGTFAYMPAPGTVLDAGTELLTVAFTPADATNYTDAGASVTLAVAKADQSITFPPIDKKSFKSPDFNAGATATSGLPVTYASSDTAVATVLGSLIHIVGGGNDAITAYQLGNRNYNPAPPQIQPLGVTGRRSQQPGLRIDTLPDGVTTANPLLVVAGSVSRIFKDGTLVVQVTNNGTTTSYPAMFSFPSGEFTQTVSLGTGLNVVQVTATSKFGATTDRRTVTLQRR